MKQQQRKIEVQPKARPRHYPASQPASQLANHLSGEGMGEQREKCGACGGVPRDISPVHDIQPVHVA